jgi:hypothetical protein
VVNSVQDGNWETGTTWDSGSVPACGDTIYIKHLVTVTTNNATLDGCGDPSFIIITGTLDFSNGDKISLDCGSGITIETGGLISAAGGGGGASNNIKICGSEVWRKSDGDVNGPSSFGSPLPVELASFTASAEQNYNEVRWTTLSENESAYFIIEKSYDGLTFSEMARIDAQGFSVSSHEYLSMDFSPGINHTFYRLKQVDQNNTIRVYSIIKIESQVQVNINVIQQGDVYTVTQEQRFKGIKVYGMDGKLILDEKNSGNSFQLPALNLPKMIIVITEGEYGRKSQKISL